MVKDANGERIVIPREHLYFTYEDHEPRHDPIYVEELLLAQLLMDRQIYLNDGQPDADGDTTVCAYVICNDIFAWACADLEAVRHHELPALYEMHMADTAWGAIKWVIYKRGEYPQGPVLKDMKATGAWDDVDESLLRSNTTDAETQALFTQVARERGPAQ